jgi:hypothetical protein
MLRATSRPRSVNGRATVTAMEAEAKGCMICECCSGTGWRAGSRSTTWSCWECGGSGIAYCCEGLRCEPSDGERDNADRDRRVSSRWTDDVSVRLH